MDECIHGLIGCATCQGLDGASPTRNIAAGLQRTWTIQDAAIAARAALTTGEVARRLGRTSSQVSAYRIGTLGMKDYAGYIPRPR